MDRNFILFFYVPPPSEASRPRCCSNKRSSGDGPGPDHNDYKQFVSDKIWFLNLIFNY